MTIGKLIETLQTEINHGVPQDAEITSIHTMVIIDGRLERMTFDAIDKPGTQYEIGIGWR